MSKRSRRRRKRKFVRTIERLRARIVSLEKQLTGRIATAPTIVTPAPKPSDEQPPSPPGWLKDELTKFIDQATRNIHATFVHKKKCVGLLRSIDDGFLRIGNNLINPKDPWAANLLPRSHSAFRGAARMAMSGQATDTFPVLRSCLEFALYALHINVNPGLAEVWINRHETEDSLKASRRQFQNVKVMDTLRAMDAKLHRTIEMLYERTIDFGGHPNERSVTGSMTMEKTPGQTEFQHIYLHGNTQALDHVLKTTAQVGLGSLCVFQHIFSDRFDILGLTAELERLRAEL